MAKPLVIAVHPSLVDQPWVQDLRDKGHMVESDMTGAWQADLILAPQACRWVDGMEAYLDALVKGARAAKYPAKDRSPAARSAAATVPGDPE